MMVVVVPGQDDHDMSRCERLSRLGSLSRSSSASRGELVAYANNWRRHAAVGLHRPPRTATTRVVDIPRRAGLLVVRRTSDRVGAAYLAEVGSALVRQRLCGKPRVTAATTNDNNYGQSGSLDGRFRPRLPDL